MTSAIRHILLDIEGTTCPVSFVSTVLFPYAEDKVSSYLERHGQREEIRNLLIELQRSWQQEEDDEARELLQRSSQGQDQQEEGSEDPQTSQSLRPELTKRLLPYIHWLIRKDRKLTAWKELQGHIWREGYDRGELKAVLFPEVSECLKLWRQCGLALSVYSSGSVPAQQLLYGHSSDGDLRELFSHWFDTRIGPKQERKSYTAITEHIGGPAGQILFVSDAVRELQAAESAGLRVVFSDRVGNPERNAGGFASISSLRELSEPLLREWWSMPPAEG